MMKSNDHFLQSVCALAIPVALQSMLQSSFSMVDQIMIGQLGEIQVASVGLAGKFASIYAVLISAIGAAAGIMISQYLGQENTRGVRQSFFANLLLMLLMLPRALLARTENEPQRALLAQFHWRQYLSLLLVCEAMWSLGENVYAAIFGHISTDASAAMTLTNPVQGVVIGALCGLSQAAGVIIGKRLGRGETEDAYWAAKRLLIYGLAGALMLSAAVMLLSGVYVKLYQVEETVKATARQLLFAYALVVPFKVLNMILGGGILRSGGQTKYVMFIDGIGTWCCGVPLGLLSAFVLRLPVAWVYFLLSLEECLRFGFSMAVFRRKKWMRRLDAGAQPSGLP